MADKTVGFRWDSKCHGMLHTMPEKTVGLGWYSKYHGRYNNTVWMECYIFYQTRQWGLDGTFTYQGRKGTRF